MGMTVHQIRERLNDCGDGLEVRIDGREVLSVQVEGQQEHRRVNFITGEAAPDAEPVTEPAEPAPGPIDGLPDPVEEPQEPPSSDEELAAVFAEDLPPADDDPLHVPVDAPPADPLPADDETPQA